MKKLLFILLILSACKKERLTYPAGTLLKFTNYTIDTTQHGVGLREPLTVINYNGSQYLCEDANVPHLFWELSANQVVKY